MSFTLLTLLDSDAAHAWALLSNGTSTVITCGSDASLDDLHAGALTAEGWFRPDGGDGNWRGVIMKGPAAGWTLFHNSPPNGLRAIVQCATTNSSAACGKPNTYGAWHHGAFTWDNGGDRKVRIFLDGQLVATGNAGVGDITSDAVKNLMIGKHYASFIGALGWQRLSKVIRYTGPFIVPSRVVPPALDVNTIEQWNLNEGAGNIAYAQVLPANNGAITDGTWVYV